MLKNLSPSEIKNDNKLNISFSNSYFKDLNINCNTYNGNFYLDSFYYFLISEEFKSFDHLYTRDKNQNIQHFFTKNFFSNFKSKIDDYKEFKNVFVLGSNSGNNYYSNLLQFLSRIFFINEKNVKIAIHRNSSTKFRKFITQILNLKGVKFSFVYLDDGFYKFTDSKIPQFLNLDKSIQILKKFLVPKLINSEDKKIYVTREDSSYRKIVNEADIVPILRSKGYKVINPQLYEIDEQIRIFSEADKIISPHGSNLSNIIFCKPGTEIFEVGPKFDNIYENIFENRYKNLAKINNLNYNRIITDTVPVENHSSVSSMYIDPKILNKSNYYKNLILRISDINNLE